jgi:hypothetical protein
LGLSAVGWSAVGVVRGSGRLGALGDQLVKVGAARTAWAVGVAGAMGEGAPRVVEGSAAAVLVARVDDGEGVDEVLDVEELDVDVGRVVVVDPGGEQLEGPASTSWTKSVRTVAVGAATVDTTRNSARSPSGVSSPTV